MLTDHNSQNMTLFKARQIENAHIYWEDIVMEHTQTMHIFFFFKSTLYSRVNYSTTSLYHSVIVKGIN